MSIVNDISVSINGDIRYTGTTENYTVLELHRFLQDLADDASSSGDDLLDITSTTPSDRSTDNIITLNPPYNIDDTLSEHLYDGSITQDGGDTVYSGLVVVGSVETGTQLQIIQNNALLTNFWGTGINTDEVANIILRILIKTRDAGNDIDGKRLRVQARELGDTYAEFSLTAGLGNSTAAIFTSKDLNNQTIEANIAALNITNSEGFQELDVDANSVLEPYYSQWSLNGNSINDLYEYTKYIQRRGTSETIHNIDGSLFRGITHNFAYDNETNGPFVEDEILTFGNGATALLLALDDNGSNGNLYIQLLTGSAPSDNDIITGGTSLATAEINGSVFSRTISPEFIGTSTGSAIIGAYGIGIVPGDLTASDQLFDLTNTLVQPPNNVQFVVAGLVSGEDTVLVTADGGSGTIDFDQLVVDGAHTTSDTTLTVTTTIPSDTPTSGTIRVFNGSQYDKIFYSSYTGKVFTLVGTLPNAVSDLANVFISYIDTLATGSTESFTVIFNTDRDLFIRVRDGGVTPIKTFETTGTLGSAGGSTTVIRTSDE